MATKPRTSDTIGVSRNQNLDFLRVTESAALSSARWVGKGKRNEADQAACEGMRFVLNELDMCGTIVIGEGERDEAPMLYIGEKLGSGDGPNIQIAVDPLEGTNLCANGTPNAISVLAAAGEDGYLMHAPDCYMDKLVVGVEAAGVVDITLPPRVNVRLMSKALGKDVDELIIGVLDRPRHDDLIAELRDVGARVHLIPDGDLSVAIAALDPDSDIDALMGVGGAPEGVITAAAVLCYGGEMQARLVFTKDTDQRERAKQMIDGDVDRVFTTTDLARGNVMFSATGITSGDLLKGVRYRRGFALTESIVMRSANGTIRRIETMHRQPEQYEF